MQIILFAHANIVWVVGQYREDSASVYSQGAAGEESFSNEQTQALPQARASYSAAEVLLQNALDKWTRNNFPSVEHCMAELYLLAGAFSCSYSDYSAAEVLLTKALAVAQHVASSSRRSYNRTALVRCRSKEAEDRDWLLLANTLEALGMLFHFQMDNIQAEEYYRRALDAVERCGDTSAGTTQRVRIAVVVAFTFTVQVQCRMSISDLFFSECDNKSFSVGKL